MPATLSRADGAFFSLRATTRDTADDMIGPKASGLAFLILAHEQPPLLARLVDRLLDSDTHTFIHIDRRSRVEPFERAISALRNPWLDNVHFLGKRRKIAYFGFSMVEATLALMKQATDFGRFSYYSLLSGVDYPIKKPARIREFFGEGDLEHIVYWRLEDRPSWQHKIQHYFPTDYIPIRNLQRPELRRFWKVGSAFRYMFWRNFYRHRWSFPRRRYPLGGMKPYGGSQWWSLTDACVRYVLERVTEQPKFIQFYRFTEAPDEMFFQTIIMNSELATQVANHEQYERWSAETPVEEKTDQSRLPEGSFNVRYIDWSEHYRVSAGTRAS
jgi:hypothetical protein